MKWYCIIRSKHIKGYKKQNKKQQQTNKTKQTNKKQNKNKKTTNKNAYLLGQKYNLQIVGVIPFVKLQNHTTCLDLVLKR